MIHVTNRYLVTIQVPVEFEDDKPLRDWAHEAMMAMVPEGGRVVSGFADTPGQAADYLAQDPRFVASMVGMAAWTRGLGSLDLPIVAGAPAVDARKIDSPSPGQYGPTAAYGEG